MRDLLAWLGAGVLSESQELLPQDGPYLVAGVSVHGRLVAWRGVIA